MNYRAVFYYIGTILKVVTGFLLIPVLTSLCYREWDALLPFLYTALIFLGGGFLLAPVPPKKKKFGSKEGLVIVGLSWVIVSLFGAFPFLFCGVTGYFDGVFETISGFTTTGATILTDIEAAPKGLLMWRSLTHWLGGMGILVFLLAVIPSSDGSTFQLMKFESPGPAVGKLVSKMRHSAAISYFIYFALTVLQVIFLLCGGVNLYESVTLAFSTAGTGGFAVLGSSAETYSVYVKIVLIVFMLVFSINFNVYYLLVIGKFALAIKNEEFLGYLLFVLLSIAAVTACVISTFASFGEALLQSAFAVASISSTTGFTITDMAQWSDGARAILAIVSIVGACAGSTGGGLKFSRVIVLVKTAGISLMDVVRPNGVHIVKLDKKPFGRSETESVAGYFILYCMVAAVSVLLLCLFGNSFEDSFYSMITTFNNVGPCLSSTVGATSPYTNFDWMSKLVLMVDMLIGRLEIFPILLLFAPQSWSRHF